MREITIKNTVGDELELVKYNPLRDLVLFFTQYPALLLIIIASGIAFIGERLLLDTHHVQVTCKPKKKDVWKK